MEKYQFINTSYKKTEVSAPVLSTISSAYEVIFALTMTI